MKSNNLKFIKKIAIIISIILLTMIFIRPVAQWTFLEYNSKCTKGYLSGKAYSSEGECGKEYFFLESGTRYNGVSNSNSLLKMKIGDSIVVKYSPLYPDFNTVIHEKK